MLTAVRGVLGHPRGSTWDKAREGLRTGLPGAPGHVSGGVVSIGQASLGRKVRPIASWFESREAQTLPYFEPPATLGTISRASSGRCLPGGAA